MQLSYKLLPSKIFCVATVFDKIDGTNMYQDIVYRNALAMFYSATVAS